VKGEVVYFYAFDVASEIVQHRVRAILTADPLPLEIRSNHTLPKDIPLYKPYSVVLAPLDALLQGKQVTPHVHVYEVGVISIIMRVPFEVAQLGNLLPYHNPQLANGKALGQVAYELCTKTCESLRAAMLQPTPLHEPEAYSVFCLSDIGKNQDIDAWMDENHSAVAELITQNPPNTLSDMQIHEVLRIQRSYTKTDRVVIDWDAALVIDQTGYVDDVLYALEIANLQLEEYKVMDQRLDRYLEKAYVDMQPRRLQFWGNYSSVLRRLRTLRVDVTKLHDEVTHITKFFGDWYLARIYMGARERFHIGQWRNSVEERLRQVDALYTVAHSELTNQRMLWLELLVVILFVIDIAGLFLLKH
jgi:hypothetical protein